MCIAVEWHFFSHLGERIIHHGYTIQNFTHLTIGQQPISPKAQE
jgi:hypothetical protein